MRPGIMEIVIILVVIIAVIVIARISRTGGSTGQQDKESSVDNPAKSVGIKTSRTRSFLTKLGIAFTLVGVILLIAGISMFKWALQSYLWSFIILVIGIVLIFLSRRK